MADYSDEIRIPITLTIPVPGSLATRMTDPRRDGPPPGFVPTRPPGWHGPRPRQPGEAVAALPHPSVHLHAQVTAAQPPNRWAAVPVTVVAGGLELVTTIEALPAVLLAVGIGVAVTLLIAGVSYAFHSRRAALSWARQLLGRNDEPEQLPMVDPLPPLPPMQAGPELPAHTGHDQPTVRLPALTTPGDRVQIPSVLPGPEIEPAAPTIMPSQPPRDPTRSDSRRARNAARQRDPAVTQRLEDVEWWAHHLINQAGLNRSADLLRAAGRAGWSMDGQGNVVALPHTAEAQRKLRVAGILRALHNSGHDNWNQRIYRELNTIRDDLNKKYGKGNSAAKDEAAAKALNDLERQLSDNVIKDDRLTKLVGHDSDATV